jgi:hypothetical protein
MSKTAPVVPFLTCHVPLILAAAIPGTPLVEMIRTRYQYQDKKIGWQGVGNSRMRFDVHVDAFHVFRPSREFRLIRTVLGMMLIRVRVDTCIYEKMLEFIRVDVAFDGQVPRGFVDPSVRPNLLEINMQQVGI